MMVFCQLTYAEGMLMGEGKKGENCDTKRYINRKIGIFVNK